MNHRVRETTSHPPIWVGVGRRPFLLLLLRVVSPIRHHAVFLLRHLRCGLRLALAFDVDLGLGATSDGLRLGASSTRQILLLPSRARGGVVLLIRQIQPIGPFILQARRILPKHVLDDGAGNISQHRVQLGRRVRGLVVGAQDQLDVHSGDDLTNHLLGDAVLGVAVVRLVLVQYPDELGVQLAQTVHATNGLNEGVPVLGRVEKHHGVAVVVQVEPDAAGLVGGGERGAVVLRIVEETGGGGALLAAHPRADHDRGHLQKGTVELHQPGDHGPVRPDDDLLAFR